MSKYTTELRYICESFAGLNKSVGYKSVRQTIEEARPLIFNFPYPIYEQSHKEELETKIIKHYYTREIAFETVGLFQLKLDAKMNEIMPYYNQLYKSAALEYDILDNVDYTRSYTRTIGGNEDTDGNSTTQGNAEGLSKYLDTPQDNIDNLLDGKYLTSASHNTSESGTTQQATSHRTHNTGEGYTEIRKGKQGGGSFASMVDEYRKTIINIDLMIIRELEELFFGLW